MSSKVIPENNPLNFTKLPPIAHVKPKDYYEDEIKKKRHTCTDVICLVIFIIFLIAQIALSILIYSFGSDPKNILLPRDSNGNLCTGSTPYLFYFNLAECLNINTILNQCTTTTVCVSQCPKENLFYLIPSHRINIVQNYCNKAYLSLYFNGTVPSQMDQSTFLNLVNQKICPVYTLQSDPLFMRCFPSFLKQAENTVQNLVAIDPSNNQTFQIDDLKQPITPSLITNSAKSLNNLINLSGIGILL